MSGALFIEKIELRESSAYKGEPKQTMASFLPILATLVSVNGGEVCVREYTPCHGERGRKYGLLSSDAKVAARFYDVLLPLLATGFLTLDGLHCFGHRSFSKGLGSFG